MQPVHGSSTDWSQAGLTHNRFWLRVVAVLAFGMAALQSFGLLEPTFGFLESASFAVEE